MEQRSYEAFVASIVGERTGLESLNEKTDQIMTRNN